MAYVFSTVNETSQSYLLGERRYNYTTPKSFLELISLYSKLLTNKTSETYQKIQRLENGLVRLAICADQVDSLKHVLAEQEIQLNVKNEAADKLIVVVCSENEIVQKEKRIGNFCKLHIIFKYFCPGELLEMVGIQHNFIIFIKFKRLLWDPSYRT